MFQHMLANAIPFGQQIEQSWGKRKTPTTPETRMEGAGRHWSEQLPQAPSIDNEMDPLRARTCLAKASASTEGRNVRLAAKCLRPLLVADSFIPSS